MTSDGHFLAFLGVSLLLIVTPGPDMALIMKKALFGRRQGMSSSLGVCLGQMIWMLASSVGVAALLVASEPLFDAIKIAGAAYLIFLGGQALLSAFRGLNLHPSRPGNVQNRTGVTSRTAFRQGLISNLGNPKMAVFFTSLLPQFVPAGQASFVSLFALGIVFCAMAAIWLVVYTALISRAGEFLRRPRIRRAIEGVTGAVLVALGLRLVTETR